MKSSAYQLAHRRAHKTSAISTTIIITRAQTKVTDTDLCNDLYNIYYLEIPS